MMGFLQLAVDLPPCPKCGTDRTNRLERIGSAGGFRIIQCPCGYVSKGNVVGEVFRESPVRDGCATFAQALTELGGGRDAF